MQPKKSIKFQTVNDVKKLSLDQLWHEGFRMIPLHQDEGEAPSWVEYIPYDYENSEEDSEEEDSGPIAMGFNNFDIRGFYTGVS